MNPGAMSQVVDPFVPIRRPVLNSRPPVTPSPQLVSPRARPIHMPAVRSIDGFTRRISVPIRPRPHATPTSKRFHTIDDIRPTSTTSTDTQHFTFDASTPGVAAVAAPPQPKVDFSSYIAAPAEQTLAAPRRLVRHLQWPAIILGAVAVGTLAQSLEIGEIAIGAYAVFALIRRVESRTTFVLALITLASIVILLAINNNSTLAANFAVYAFLFLVIGTVSLGIELHRSEA